MVAPPNRSDDIDIYMVTLCIPCHKQFEKGSFCPMCLHCYNEGDDDLTMVCCDNCDR